MRHAPCNIHYWIFLLFFAFLSFSAQSVEECRGVSQQSIANAFTTPFGLVSSDTGNLQYYGSLNCSGYGVSVRHVQRFNGGRDNTIVGVFYAFKLGEKWRARVSVDHLDVHQPSFEVPRFRLKLAFRDKLNYSAELFQFFNGKDQRLLLWSVSDSYTLDSGDELAWKVGGSFHSGFGLQDRYYAETGYRKKLTENWSWRLRYQYQHQPMHANIGILDVIYAF